MKKWRSFSLFIFLLSVQGSKCANLDSVLFFKSNIVDTIFGIPVPDPYRWLESLNSDSTREWLQQQKNIAEGEKIDFRGRYTDAYNTLHNFSGVSSNNLIRKGNFYFRFAYDADWKEVHITSPVLWFRDSINGREYIACDPNTYSRKDKMTIEDFTVSEDGKFLVVSLSRSGSDWREIRVKNLIWQNDLPDTVKWVKFSNVVWWDNGFFYSRYKYPPANGVHLTSNTKQQLYYHKLGESQESDKLLYTIPDEANSVFHFAPTANNRYLVIYTKARVNNEWCNAVVFKDLSKGIFAEMNLLIVNPPGEKSEYEVIDMVNNKFVVVTNAGAPHGRVLLFDKDSINHASSFIPEYEEVLQSLHHVGKKLVGIYFNKSLYNGAIFNYDGKLLSTLRFDPGANVEGFLGSPDDSEVLYTQNTFYYPRVVYKLNLNRLTVNVIEKTGVSFNADQYETSIVTYKSKDSTEIAMYLTYKKGLKLTKSNPLILYGYGGFGRSVTPFYNFSDILFFANGGILAVPLIRGGGEEGEKWHEAGERLNKQNTFDDFIAAAEFLVANNYTSPKQLVIKGGSNGGLLVGVMLTQRPDLFKAAVAKMGVFDMVRYHLFTSGRFLTEEYGSASDSVEFKNLLSYSPYHGVKSGIAYPALLLVTAENDDRVPPFHTYKFLARIQKESGGESPHILYFEDEAGHKGDATIEGRTREDAFELGFIFDQLKITMKPQF